MDDRHGQQHAPPSRCLAVWVVTTAVAAAIARLLAPQVAVPPAGHPFADRLVWLCAAAGLAGTAWLWLLTTTVAVEALTGARASSGVPLPLRRLVFAACGVVLAGAAPAVATPVQSHTASHAGAQDPTAALFLAGLPLPDRAEGVVDEVVVVRAGDTLWALAERSLPPAARAGAVTARWHLIYALNRDRIGPDPDLIQPGQRLRLPPP
jgi:hypothetical protein